MIQPAVPAEIVLEGNAQFYFFVVVYKFQDKVVSVEIESCPQLFYCVIVYHEGWCLFVLLEKAKAQLIDDADAGLPPSEKRRFSDLSRYLSSFLLGLADLKHLTAPGCFSHKLQFERYNFGKDVVVVIQTELMQLFMVDCKVDIFLFQGQLHLAKSIDGPGEKQFDFIYIVYWNCPFSKVNYFLFELEVFL